MQRVTGAAVIARDITHMKRQQSQLQSLLAKERVARTDAEAAQRALAEQNRRLRELDRLKDEFISLVSHELRTPLTSIRGYVELLLDGGAGGSDDQGQFLSVVDRNSKRLMHLVGDLLFLAQIRRASSRSNWARIQLGDVVSESVEAAKPIADEQGIRLRASLDATPNMVGDRGRLGQVLDNSSPAQSSSRPKAAPSMSALVDCRRSADRSRRQRNQDRAGGAGALVRPVLPQQQATERAIRARASA